MGGAIDVALSLCNMSLSVSGFKDRHTMLLQVGTGAGVLRGRPLLSICGSGFKP